MDLVLPFVDCMDPIWRKQYMTEMGYKSALEKMDVSRFRPFETLRFLFRSVEKNLKFIDRIVLIVSSESQVPEWVNREKVRIILHGEFIPGEQLPTFNSSAIESYMWRIDGLSELFVYGNDDIFAMMPMEENDFFLKDRPRLIFEKSDFHYQNLFRRCCRRGMDMAADAAGVSRSDPFLLIKPQHSFKGMSTKRMKELGRKIEPLIPGTITKLRHWDNFTGYVYQYYDYYLGEFEPFERSFQYIRISDDFDEILKVIDECDTDTLCINDAGDLSNENYERACQELKEHFGKVFPDRSCYELF